MANNWDTLHFTDFKDLQEKAYAKALDWRMYNFQKRWLDNYTKRYAPSSEVRLFRSTIESYGNYLQGKITKVQGEQDMREIESKYNKFHNTIKKVFGFHLEMDKAFEEQNQEFGEITFECPVCNGQAYGARYSTPDNMAHKVTMRAGCHGCGIKMMN
ncbi:hypothetical protein [Bacillus sp. AFS040349]|uniref:hypothetical protein n=1 Tax=Bacillus sp. AFS040349 TaxID=2033502 RepID=UPI000BFBC4C3|nr:hypothetical protein [Bacillus sp. AFS040349]PGT83245.1 hypothetical protein COD11_12990 [Bacillus sp. AFS040349]